MLQTNACDAMLLQTACWGHAAPEHMLLCMLDSGLAYHRLGQIYKEQNGLGRALECFQAICDSPPPPVTKADVWFLIGSVQESMEGPAPEYARQAYIHVLRLLQIDQGRLVARVYRQVCRLLGHGTYWIAN